MISYEAFIMCLIIIVLFTVIHYWYNNICHSIEGYTSDLSNEAIQNIAAVYNQENMVLSNLTVTGKLTVGGDIACTNATMSNNVQSKNATISDTLNVNGKTTLQGNDVPLTLKTKTDNNFLEFVNKNNQRDMTLGINSNKILIIDKITEPTFYKSYWVSKLDNTQACDGSDIATRENITSADDCYNFCTNNPDIQVRNDTNATLYRKSDKKCFCKTCGTIKGSSNDYTSYFIYK